MHTQRLQLKGDSREWKGKRFMVKTGVGRREVGWGIFVYIKRIGRGGEGGGKLQIYMFIEWRERS